MKIAMADNASLKFSQDIKAHWIEKGHEVRYEPGASEHLAQWADLYYVDWSDNNIHYLWRLYHGQEVTPEGWDNNKKPVFAVRAIDWDVWLGHARSQEIIDFVDKYICIAPHIEKKLRAEASFPEGKLKLIRPGVNLKQFTPKKAKTDGFQLGMVLGDMWWPKNHMGGLDIFYTLFLMDNRWRLHIRGQHEPGEYWQQMYEYYLDSRGLRDVVTLYASVDDMNDWYEKIDVLLHPGMKEAFSYATAEAAAKGIPVVVNDFYGSHDIWPEEWLYKNHTEALVKLNNPGKDYRKYIKDNYSIERMLKEYDEFLGT